MGLPPRESVASPRHVEDNPRRGTDDAPIGVHEDNGSGPRPGDQADGSQHQYLYQSWKEYAMSVILDYYVFIHRLEKTDKRFHAAFTTTQITASPTGGLPTGVDNEVEAGVLFTAIRSRHLLSCVIPGAGGRNSAAIHTLLATPNHQPMLEINISFLRHIHHKEAKLDTVFDPKSGLPPVFKTREENLLCEQTIATLTLSKVELNRFRATDAGTYTADFRVTGGTETEYVPEAECEQWLKV
jgi:hypothetical protein